MSIATHQLFFTGSHAGHRAWIAAESNADAIAQAVRIVSRQAHAAGFCLVDNRETTIGGPEVARFDHIPGQDVVVIEPGVDYVPNGKPWSEDIEVIEAHDSGACADPDCRCGAACNAAQGRPGAVRGSRCGGPVEYDRYFGVVLCEHHSILAAEAEGAAEAY